MGVKARCGLFHGTSGALKFKLDIQYFSSKIFTKKGSVTEYSLKKHGQDFLNKEPIQIKEMMTDVGYECKIKRGHKNSTLIIAENPSKARNITQVQISPIGSAHHGPNPYVKISTKDIGVIKVVKGSKVTYKKSNEKAKTIFKRGEKKA